MNDFKIAIQDFRKEASAQSDSGDSSEPKDKGNDAAQTKPAGKPQSNANQGPQKPIHTRQWNLSMPTVLAGIAVIGGSLGLYARHKWKANKAQPLKNHQLR